MATSITARQGEKINPTEAAALKQKEDNTPVALPEYKLILIAVDAFDHSNRGVADAAELGKLWQSTILRLDPLRVKVKSK